MKANEVKPGTRCECRGGRVDRHDAHAVAHQNQQFPNGMDAINVQQCHNPAVRLVTYRPRIGMALGLKVTRALCAACADFHEKGARRA